MRCKGYEHKLIKASDRELSPEELLQMEKHTDHCFACMRFQDDLNKIRLSIKQILSPSLSMELDERTKDLCLEESKNRDRSNRHSLHKNWIPIPGFIWAALLILTALTVIILFPVIKDFKMELPLSRKTVAVLILLMQNAVMLFFAPIILRKYQPQEKQWSSV